MPHLVTRSETLTGYVRGTVSLDYVYPILSPQLSSVVPDLTMHYASKSGFIGCVELGRFPGFLELFSVHFLGD